MATISFFQWVKTQGIDTTAMSEKDIPALKARWEAATGQATGASEKKPRKASLVTFELRVPTGEEGVYHAFPLPVTMVPGRGAETLKSNARELAELRAQSLGLDVSEAQWVRVEPA